MSVSLKLEPNAPDDVDVDVASCLVAGIAGIVQMDRDGALCIAVIGDAPAVTTVKSIGALAAFKHVVARPGNKMIVASAADQRVVTF